MQAAILLIKLRYLTKWNKKRDEIAKYYSKHLQNLDITLPQVGKNKVHVWHQYVIRSGQRDKIRSKLAEKEISSGLHYPSPLHLQPSFKQLEYSKGDFPIAEKCSDEILSLPIYPEMTAEMVKYVVDNLTNICRELR